MNSWIIVRANQQGTWIHWEKPTAAKRENFGIRWVEIWESRKVLGCDWSPCGADGNIWNNLRGSFTLDFVTFVIFCIFVRHHLLMALRESMGGLPVREGARGREAFPRSNSTAVRCRLQLRRSQLRQHSWATTCCTVCWQQWGEPIYWQYRYVKLKREQTSSDNTNKKLNKNDEQHGNVTSRKGDWNIFSKEVTEIWSQWMLDLALPIKVSISPGKQFDVRWAIFWKLLLFTDAADSVSVLHNVFANQRRVCKSNTIVSKIPRVSWK